VYYSIPYGNVVARYQVSTDPDVADPASGTILLTAREANQGINHNGGRMEFGPDGYLYIGMGDGGYVPGLAQDLGSLLGRSAPDNVRL
jgi:glucose/arabinose dehydrogenase